MKEDIVFFGMDPGKDGYITAFDPSTGEHKFYAMPTHKVETGKLLKSGKPQMKDSNRTSNWEARVVSSNQFQLRAYGRITKNDL